MVDYDEKEGDLYIRFKEVAKYSEGEPTDDGLVIVHRDSNTRKIAAIEILSLSEL